MEEHHRWSAMRTNDLRPNDNARRPDKHGTAGGVAALPRTAHAHILCEDQFSCKEGFLGGFFTYWSGGYGSYPWR